METDFEFGQGATDFPFLLFSEFRTGALVSPSLLHNGNRELLPQE
jgi:hypothetical protein